MKTLAIVAIVMGLLLFAGVAIAATVSADKVDNSEQPETIECSGCGNCVEVCPFGVLEIKNGKAVVKDLENCKKCGACISACSNNAIKINKEEK